MVLGKITEKHLHRMLLDLPQVVFEVTESCNLKCEYCALSDFYENGKGRAGKKMSLDTAITTLKYIFNLWSEESNGVLPERFYISFYGGEPLLNIPLIEEIVNFTESNGGKVGRKIVFSMTTNGVLLDKYIDYLVQHEFSLMVSLDGDQTADSYRVDASGRPSYYNVYANLINIRTKYPDYFRQNIHFNAVLNGRSGYEGIIKYFKEEFDVIPHVSYLSMVDLNEDKRKQFENLLNHSEIDYSCVPMEGAPRFMSFMRRYHALSGNYFDDLNALFYDRSEFPVLPTGTCVPFARKMFVTVGGDILQCEKINRKNVLGSVKDGKVHLDLTQIAEEHNTKITRYSDQCLRCDRSRFCSVCVFQVSSDKCLDFCSKSAGLNYVDSRAYTADALEKVSLYKVSI